MSAKKEDPGDIVALFRRLTMGVYAVGVTDGQRRDAFTAAWIMQASFNPLMLAVSINPDNASYAFRNEKIFQVSSDTFPQGRDTYASNLKWAQHAFNHKMMFQAESNSTEAARGIGDSNPPPTRLA